MTNGSPNIAYVYSYWLGTNILFVIYIDFDVPTNNFNIIYKTLGMSTM